jgi:hypothetical protein
MRVTKVQTERLLNTGPRSEAVDFGNARYQRISRVFQSTPNLLHATAKRRLRQVQVITEKLVEMLKVNPKRLKRLLREMLQVLGHDNIAAPDYRGGQHMAITRIWQPKRRYERLVTRDEAVSRSTIHEFARPFQSGTIAVWFIAEQALDPLPMNIRRPLRSMEVCHSKLQKQIPHGCRIKSVCIKQG